MIMQLNYLIICQCYGKRSAVITDKRLFSDTYYHLNRCGAQERTKSYIDSLHEGNVMINGSCKQMKIIE